MMISLSCFRFPGSGYVDVLRDSRCYRVSDALHAQVDDEGACVCGSGVVEFGECDVRAESCRVYFWGSEGG